jgi:hypothetical protein
VSPEIAFAMIVDVPTYASRYATVAIPIIIVLALLVAVIVGLVVGLLLRRRRVMSTNQ